MNLPYGTQNCLLQKGCKIKLGSVKWRGDVVKCRCNVGGGGVQSVAQPFPGHSVPFIINLPCSVALYSTKLSPTAKPAEGSLTALN